MRGRYLMLLANLFFDPRSQGPCKKKTMWSTSNKECRRGFIGSDLYRLGGPHYIYCQKPVMCITCIYERHFEVPFMPAHPVPEGDVLAQMKTTFVSLRRGCAHTHLRKQARTCAHKQTLRHTYFMLFLRGGGRRRVIHHYSRLLCLHSSLPLLNSTAANSQNC